MRTIKFRAFHKEDKTMHDVARLDFCTNCALIKLESGRHREVDLSELDLMQFTGLYDKNGKEIYEGDILKGNFHTPIQVYFSNGRFKANTIGKDKQGELTWHGHLMERTEIIGNIHDNPKNY